MSKGEPKGGCSLTNFIIDVTLFIKFREIFNEKFKVNHWRLVDAGMRLLP